MPHIHLLIGIIFVNTLQIDSFSNMLLILGCVLPDADIFLGILQKKNHRTYFPHYPMVWIFLTSFSFLLKSNFYWFFLGGFIHLMSDMIDWNVYIFAPFSNYSVSFLNLDPLEILEEPNPVNFIQNYYRKKQIIVIELIIFLFGVFTLIWN